MAGENYEISEEEEAPRPDESVVNTGPSQPVPGEAQQVEHWLKKIAKAKKHHEKAFKRMRVCQQIATHGALEEWLSSEMRYVAPIVMRHVNQAVSQLYARNPTAFVECRERLLHKVWDGTKEQVTHYLAQAAMGDPMATTAIAAIRTDIAEAQAMKNMVERSANTLRLLFEHQLDQQPFTFKTKLKQCVRRTKVNGVSYIKIGFLRETEMRPEISAQMEDTQAKIRTIERLTQDVEDGDTDDYEVKKLELESLVRDLQEHPDRVVREQLIFDYPRSTEIILDPETRDLKTLEGCGWLAHPFDFTAEKIKDVWDFDIEAAEAQAVKDAREMMGDHDKPATYRCYEVQNKYTQQIFVIAEGTERYVQAPKEPDIWFERFFNIIPLVFNEIENDKELYPPSDVWALRHAQYEYNRSREGLREHRVAARPYWLAAKGRLEREEKNRLSNHDAHEIVEVVPDGDGKPISSVLERGPTAPIDPNLYEVESLHTDMQRSVGTQEANLGGTSGATATESSIAESSRMSSLSDNVDDLDDMLSLLTRISGQVLLQQMTKERVIEIVGPGAVWPEFQLKRKELADEITLVAKAGSSGRPNQAAKLANLERAWPALSQIPGLNPTPLAEEYSELLDIDFSELQEDGVMSIVAQNAIAGSAPPMGGVPSAQGLQGSAPPSVPESPGAQPAYPTNPGEMQENSVA